MCFLERLLSACDTARAECVQMGTPQYGEPSVNYDQVTEYMGVHPPKAVGQSEDCLVLNVFAPAARNGSSPGGNVCGAGPSCNVCAACCHAWIAPGKDCDECVAASCDQATESADPSNASTSKPLLAVLLWVHGGAYENGAGALPLYPLRQRFTMRL